MPAGLPVAILLFAQAASSATSHEPTPPAPVTAAPVKGAERECVNQNKDPKANEIVVCAIKPQGYRIDPDVLEARRQKKQGPGSQPHNPHETYADHSCATVGPMGCRGVPTVNVLAAALVAAKMADHLSKGQEIGSMFETTPTTGEYK